MDPQNPRNEDARAAEIKALARDYAEDAIAALVEVVRDSEEKGAARAMAAKTLIQVGDLMPERTVNKRVDHHIYDERQAHLAALQKLSAQRQLPAPDAQEPQDAEFVEIKGAKRG
jgi:HEAT repeat protein